MTVRGQRRRIGRADVRLRIGDARTGRNRWRPQPIRRVFDDVRLEPGVIRIEALIEGAGNRPGPNTSTSSGRHWPRRSEPAGRRRTTRLSKALSLDRGVAK